jgi:hypothetical protein
MKSTKSQLDYYLFCQDCKIYLGRIAKRNKNRSLPCTGCEKIIKMDVDKINYFSYTNLRKLIKKLLEKPHINSQIIHETASDGPNISSTFDGSNHRNLKKKYEDLATYDIFVDGAPIFLGAKNSMWCILLSLNCLPVILKQKNIIISAIWYGKIEPIFEVFFKPLRKWSLYLATTGVTWKFGEQLVNTKFHVLNVIADSVARAKIQNMVGHKGGCSCPWCLHPNVALGRNFNRFEMLENTPVERTDEQWTLNANQADNQNLPVNGINGTSCMNEMLELKPMSSFNVDAMHQSSLGVAKYIATKLWIKKARMGYYIGSPAVLKRLNKYLTTIRLPHFRDTRLPRNFNERKLWKASEWKFWKYYISLPILLDIMPPLFVAHWAMYVKALFLLNQSEVTPEDIILAHKLLVLFSWNVQTLYGKTYMTFNLHLSLHLAACVIRSGPLWCTGAFPYESYIGKMKKFVTGSKGVVNQIVERFVKLSEMPYFIEKNSNHDAIKTFCLAAVDPSAKMYYTNDEISLYSYKGRDLENGVSTYGKLIKNGVVYRSSAFQQKTRNMDSCIMLKNNAYGIINSITTSINSNVISLTVQLLNTECLSFEEFGIQFDINHIMKAEKTDRYVIVPASNISEKCIYLEFKDLLYICRTVNSFEMQ